MVLKIKPRVSLLNICSPLLSYPRSPSIVATLEHCLRNRWKRGKLMRRDRSSDFQELVCYLQRKIAIKLGLFLNLQLLNL